MVQVKRTFLNPETMPEITQTTAADIRSKLPQLVPFDSADVSGGIDLLICCAGFEDRATAIVDDLRSIEVRASILIVYPTNSDDNAAAIAKFLALGILKKPVEIVYERSAFFKNLRSAVLGWKEKKGLRVTVDLSGMASYVIYRVLTVIWDELSNAKLSVYYAEARDYAPFRHEWEAFYSNVPEPRDNLAIAESYEQTHFQSRGIEDTYESDVFPGLNAGPIATQIAAFPSFSLQRMKSMLAFAETNYNVRPQGVRWFLGKPPDTERNGWRFGALSALYNVEGNSTDLSTLEYRDTFAALDDLWSESYIESHTVIAPLGSKMQHLGCFLFLKTHRECGLLLCEPREFIAGKYSFGVGSRWLLDFSDISALRSLVASRCELQFIWNDG